MSVKINVVHDNSTYLGQYENVHLDELDNVYDGSVSELLCDKAVEFGYEDPLPTMIKKIKHGGTLKLVLTSLHDIARDLHYRTLTLSEAVSRLGAPRYYDTENICSLLENSGFQIMKKRINNYEFFVEAVRS